MARNKRRLRNRRPKNDMQEALVLCLNQKRHDSAGNRIKGYTFDEIAAMGSVEREKVRQAGWLATQKLEGKSK